MHSKYREMGNWTTVPHISVGIVYNLKTVAEE